ncbi:MAG TPA: hypothetical protein VGO22_15845, partial [Pseudorhizobium sp.]|nr:hypothetical protein [Pseudorhizobium sp.]
GTSGANLIKADAFQTFVKQSEQALRMAGLTDEQLRTMKNLAADLHQANRSVSSTKIPGGSDTMQNALAAEAVGRGGSLLSRVLGNAALAGGGGFLGGPVGMILGGTGGIVATAMRQAGLSRIDELVIDALLNPERARMLMQKATPKQAKAMSIILGQAYRRATMAALASSGSGGA